MRDVVAIAFTPAPASQNPNLRRTTDTGAADSYYRALVVTLASVRRWNASLQLTLITDADVPAPFVDALDRLAVDVLETPFGHRPPAGFSATFSASLYTIDAIHGLARSGTSGDRYLLLDPDVLCTGALDPAFDLVRGDQWLVYPTGFPATEKSQGLSANDAAPLHSELDPGLVGPPTHFGGELYGFTGSGAEPVLERAERAWDLAIRNWSAGEPYFLTEEHLLNYALRRAPLAEATPFIRRVWTAPVYRTVRGDEGSLLLWHLPSEKDRAFVEYHRAALDTSSWFWRAPRPEFIARAGALAGIPRRSLRRWGYDTAGRSVRTLQRTARTLRSTASRR